MNGFRDALTRPTACRPRLLITADDFGRDPIGTANIAACLVDGRISAASLMANGASFEAACECIRRLGLHGRIGIHIALDEGPPLSPEMLRFADDGGQLCLSRRLWPLGAALGRAVAAECEAQISRMIAAGITPMHLDSHRHIHTVLPIGQIVIRVASAFRIGYVRPARNLTRSGAFPGRVYKWMFSRYVARYASTADYFGDIEDFCRLPYPVRPGTLTELMVHLDGSARGQRGMALVRRELAGELRRQFEVVGHELR